METEHNWARRDRQDPNEEPSMTVHDADEGTRGRPTRACTDGGTNWTDLTGFQRDLLQAIRHCTREGTTPTGQEIKDHLETNYAEEINNGRLYQNLNELVERDLLEKGFVDGRTNTYRLSDRAMVLLDETVERLADVCEMEVVGPAGVEDIDVPQ